MSDHPDTPHPVDSTFHACCNTIGHHTPDCDLAPIELDSPDPALARWQELADRDLVIEHNGDAEKVMPFPRPAWATPDGDIVDGILGNCYYTSDWAEVVVRNRRGSRSDRELNPAQMCVRAKLCGNGRTYIGLALLSVIDGKWKWSEGVGLTPAEALELADVLRAAVDLVGGAD